MKQITKARPKRTNRKRVTRPRREKTQQYGTSKLEEDFAREFLDKLGLEYIYQFEAKDIGRWYDFYLQDHNLLIEVDGGYFHSDPRVVTEGKLNPMQKRNKRVDKLKNEWALMHGIPIMRIWEKDIRENPQKVMNDLKERLHMQEHKIEINKRMSKRHVNRLKKNESKPIS